MSVIFNIFHWAVQFTYVYFGKRTAGFIHSFIFNCNLCTPYLYKLTFHNIVSPAGVTGQ